jgi:hypothetical protein
MEDEAMTEHDFMLKREAPPGAEPEVRLWVEDQQTCHLGSEQELELLRTGLGSGLPRFELARRRSCIPSAGWPHQAAAGL